MVTWTAVLAGYLVPAAVAGLGLRLVGDAIRRWARRETSFDW